MSGFLTPGEPKPVEKLPSSGAKRPRSAEAATAPTTRTAQLSGATRNMRFMQRHNGSHSPKDRQQSKKDQQQMSPPHPLDDEQAMDETGTYSPLEHAFKSSKVIPAVEVASPLDMYGRDQCLLLGRRSFGGFNPTTAENLYAQQVELDGLRPKKAQSASEAQSEQKMVQRYKDLVQNRNGSNRKAHLDKNTNPGKKMNGISTGSQRKRKGELDDMLLDS